MTTKTRTRTRRTAEQMIADLEAEIARVRARAEQAKAKKDPSLRHINAAVRSLDKAAVETKDAASRTAIAEARATLAACLALHGAGAAANGTSSRVATPRTVVDPKRVLKFLKAHPGSRSEEIAADLEADTVSLRKALHELRDEGKVKVTGKARATRYTAA